MRPIAIYLLLCLCSHVFADRLVYNYDASGNRTSIYRQIVLRGEPSPDDDSMPRNHNLSLRNVTVYPNPTQGQLRVEITGGETFDGASITIYSASGTIVFYADEIDTVNDMDLTRCSEGIYLMIIRIDGETSSWKIIKI